MNRWRETFRKGRLAVFASAGVAGGGFQAGYDLWVRHNSVGSALLIGALAGLLIVVASIVGALTRVWLDRKRGSDPWRA